MCPSLRPFQTLCYFCGEWLLAPHPSPQLEDHPFSSDCNCLLNIFAATLHVWRTSSSTSWGCTIVWRQGTHLTRGKCSSTGKLSAFLIWPWDNRNISCRSPFFCIEIIILHIVIYCQKCYADWLAMNWVILLGSSNASPLSWSTLCVN